MIKQKLQIHVIPVMVSLSAISLFAQKNWAGRVRIGGFPLSIAKVDSIIEDAKTSYVFGIETDNDITGRYESFIDPSEKLQAIKKLTDSAHAIMGYPKVYSKELTPKQMDGKLICEIPPIEYITLIWGES